MSDEAQKFRCGLEHTWIDGRFAHIRHDGVIQVVSNEHYYHPEQESYDYTPLAAPSLGEGGDDR